MFCERVTDRPKCTVKVHRVRIGVEMCRHALKIALFVFRDGVKPRSSRSDTSGFEFRHQSRNGRADVASNGRRYGAIAVEFHWRNIHLDEAGRGRPLRGFAVSKKPVQSRSNQHHYIGLGKNERASRSRRLRMAIRQESLGHGHRKIRYTCRLNE